MENANSVNIEKRAYHHGDLRAALIAEGLKLLERSDSDSLSLREVARNAGVTATSVYRHFPDKQALLAALACEGLERLGVEQRAAAAKAGGGDAGFAATGRAYVRFALANPALFRLIFASGGQDRQEAGLSSSDVMAFLRQNAAAFIGAGLDDPATAIEMLRAWSMVHGLAMLMLDGQVPADDAIIDRVVGD